jgi:hypothetical protein
MPCFVSFGVAIMNVVLLSVALGSDDPQQRIPFAAKGFAHLSSKEDQKPRS